MKKRAAGILLIVLSVGALGFWELWGRENISFYKIAVLKNSVEEGTEIRQDMLVPIKADKITEGAVLWNDADELIGKEACQFVVGGVELHHEFFREPMLRIGEKYNRFILLIPDTWLMSCPESIRRGDKALFYLGEKRVCEALVAHVKDSYGQEITYSDRSRFFPSGNIKSVEIIVNQAQLEKLNRLAQKGNRFTLIYTEGGAESD